MPYAVRINKMDPPTSRAALRDELSGEMKEIPRSGEVVIFGDMHQSQFPDNWDGDPKTVKDKQLLIERIGEAEALQRGWTPPAKRWVRKGASVFEGIAAFVLAGARCPRCKKPCASDQQLRELEVGDADKGSRDETARSTLIIVGARSHQFPGKHSQDVCMAEITVQAPLRGAPTIPTPAALRDAVAKGEGFLASIKQLLELPSVLEKERGELVQAQKQTQRLLRRMQEATASGDYGVRADAWKYYAGHVAFGEDGATTAWGTSISAHGIASTIDAVRKAVEKRAAASAEKVDCEERRKAAQAEHDDQQRQSQSQTSKRGRA